ncbi:protein FLUORESCENT IN BLUE LIGHT, chloroplastic-like protein isoform X1 [Cinnamomum micranthum f. kanehirae]|uniref:Protein FLUORESCENT IN BLUE LIGHT, chloroplastic-like protein isoform X1 n=1 Tax=Cinnamomum micranthum f. kanehirae TaxID=337451 RepID=A0A3S3M9G1_9MAGN|nr:protein FLUORESCENT IN BLUE LIGHT, chloroplastic-like protein isoform X1 [Cinnamomum micranthum f. kanehirae]
MALMLRSSCPPSRSNPCGGAFRPSPPSPANFSGKIHPSEKPTLKDLLHVKILKHARERKISVGTEVAAFFPFRRKTIISPFIKTSMRTQMPIEIDQVDSESDDLQKAKCKETCDANQKLPGYCSIIIEKLLEHQRMELFSFPTTFVVTNALMFILPNESLAETCKSDTFSIFNMPLLFAIALIGATVGGLLARQRRGELTRLNDQLRQINAALRRQAKIESYAPNLSYAPVGASLQRQSKYRDAIKYHSMVLAISEREGEDSGNTEAYGAIADCYTELGDLERAAKFYDKYISRLETD